MFLVKNTESYPCCETHLMQCQNIGHKLQTVKPIWQQYPALYKHFCTYRSIRGTYISENVFPNL